MPDFPTSRVWLPIKLSTSVREHSEHQLITITLLMTSLHSELDLPNFNPRLSQFRHPQELTWSQPTKMQQHLQLLLNTNLNNYLKFSTNTVTDFGSGTWLTTLPANGQVKIRLGTSFLGWVAIIPLVTLVWVIDYSHLGRVKATTTWLLVTLLMVTVTTSRTTITLLTSKEFGHTSTSRIAELLNAVSASLNTQVQTQHVFNMTSFTPAFSISLSQWVANSLTPQGSMDNSSRLFTA